MNHLISFTMASWEKEADFESKESEISTTVTSKNQKTIKSLDDTDGDGTSFPQEIEVKGVEEDRNEELKIKLQRFYKTLVLPCVDWLPKEDRDVKNYYVELQQIDWTKKCEQRQIKLEELFEKVDGCPCPPKRILVESPPGFGKTSMATKLTYDWATNEQYLRQFQLLFLIELRNLYVYGDSSLEDEMEQISKHCGFHEPMDLSEEKQEKMLLILDGYEDHQLRENSRKDIIKVLYQQRYPSMSILVTSRTGLLPLKREKLKELFPNFPQLVTTKYYDKMISIAGIGQQNVRKFYATFFPDQNHEQIISPFKELRYLSNNVTDLLSSPLFLYMIGYFSNCNLKVDRPLSLVDLYFYLTS